MSRALVVQHQDSCPPALLVMGFTDDAAGDRLVGPLAAAFAALTTERAAAR